ncbi:MAG: carboxypeptidase-like regulatory domain-containing protein [Bacteroidota bacterium]
MNRVSIYFVFSLLFLCTSLSSFAQQQTEPSRTLRGKVVDAHSGEPIPFAHLISLNTLAGTVSSHGGKFRITIPVENHTDTLRVTCLGYQDAHIAVPASNDLVVELQPTQYKMNQVTVTAKQSFRQDHLGMRFLNPIRTVYGFSFNHAASYYIKKKWEGPTPFRLDRARVHLAEINNDSIIMRVRFLEVDSASGLPGKPIIDRNLTTQFNAKKGWVEFDFQDDDPIWMNQSEFYLVFDWVETPNSTGPIAPMFSFSILSNNPTLKDTKGNLHINHPLMHTLFISYSD